MHALTLPLAGESGFRAQRGPIDFAKRNHSLAILRWNANSPCDGNHIFRVRDSYVNWRYGAIDLDAPVGKRGEQAAARLLRRKKLVVVAESESDKAGEIDLIAIDRKTRHIIFVEVKTHSTTKPGNPSERVDENKQRRVTQAAMRYLKRKKLLGTPCRFDVIAVWWPTDMNQPEKIVHYESAFEATGEYQMF